MTRRRWILPLLADSTAKSTCIHAFARETRLVFSSWKYPITKSDRPAWRVLPAIAIRQIGAQNIAIIIAIAERTRFTGTVFLQRKQHGIFNKSNREIDACYSASGNVLCHFDSACGVQTGRMSKPTYVATFQHCQWAAASHRHRISKSRNITSVKLEPNPKLEHICNKYILKPFVNRFYEFTYLLRHRWAVVCFCRHRYS